MIHIIGANGYIGKNLTAYLRDINIEFLGYSELSDASCQKLDITEETYSISLNENDVVILLAAVSSPDICNNNFELAYNVNVRGTTRFIEYCINKNSNVIFISSDTVNGPTAENIEKDELSKAEPFGNYAKMKYEVEERFKDDKRFKTLRLSYVLSLEDKFTKYLKKCADKCETAEVFDGLYRNVVSLETVLESIASLAINFDFNDYYLCNVSGNRCLSRADLAKEYKNKVDGRLNYRIVPIPQEMLEGRPNIIRTKSLFLKKLLGHDDLKLYN